jgi:hypothetical protein
MAQVYRAKTSSIYRIERFRGLNESADAESSLKGGEATAMSNFKITPEGHLRVRPGLQTLTSLGSSPVRGLWTGYIGGTEHTLAACGGVIWRLNLSDGTKQNIGYMLDKSTNFFGFNGKVYILNGSQYFWWAGSGNVSAVVPYVPLIAVSTPPAGGGTLLERLNVLTGLRRQRFSPDGASSLYHLAEKAITQVTKVSVNGNVLASDLYGVNVTQGMVTFGTGVIPPLGENTVEIEYRKGNGSPELVTAMRFAETYNGLTDTRVFLYGNGSNRAIYSGLDEFGEPRADYFPEMNEVQIDSSNAAITAMIRHYDKLLAFKENGMWAITYGAVTLSDGSITGGFYVIPVNGEIGNLAPGQVKLVENSPISLYSGAFYTWSVTGVRDERSAKRFSERADKLLAESDLSAAVVIDDNFSQEYCVHLGTKCVVYEYGTSVFYLYENLPEISCGLAQGGDRYLGTTNGKIMKMSDSIFNDDGTAISCSWQAGLRGFGREMASKYSSGLWIRAKSEFGGLVSITAQDEKVQNRENMAVLNSGEVQIVKLRLNIRKFKLAKWTVQTSSPAITLLGIDIMLR